MEISNYQRRDKIIAAVSTALLFLAIIGMVIIHDSNKSLEDLLNVSRLKNETILSEKLALDKEILDYKKEMKALRGKNKELDKYLTSANEALNHKEQKIKTILRDNPRVRSLEAELIDIRKMRLELETQVVSLSGKIIELESKNRMLTSEIASLAAENKTLNTQNELMKAFAANNYQIEATRGNRDRLTVVARKTKRLKIGFDLPQDVAENVQFKIRTPKGDVITKDDNALSATALDSEDGSDLMVSLMPMEDFEVSKRIEMRYEPKKKLQKGLYTIDIYNGETYMVSCQLKLR